MAWTQLELRIVHAALMIAHNLRCQETDEVDMAAIAAVGRRSTEEFRQMRDKVGEMLTAQAKGITPEGFITCGYCQEPGFDADQLEQYAVATTHQQWQCACGNWNDRTPQPAEIDLSHVEMNTVVWLYAGDVLDNDGVVRDEAEPDWQGTLYDFLQANKSIEPTEILAIWQAFQANDAYTGGGGAAVGYTLDRPDDDGREEGDCTSTGHSWVEGPPDRGDEGPIRCEYCGADGDA